MRWFRRAEVRPGDRPSDVFIVNRTTGEKLPCELAYLGVSDEGMHEWGISAEMDLATEKLTIGVFPPRTSIRFVGLAPREGGVDD